MNVLYLSELKLETGTIVWQRQRQDGYFFLTVTGCLDSGWVQVQIPRLESRPEIISTSNMMHKLISLIMQTYSPDQEIGLSLKNTFSLFRHWILIRTSHISYTDCKSVTCVLLDASCFPLRLLYVFLNGFCLQPVTF